MELSLAIIQESVLITELRTLVAEHANNQCEWENQQMSTIVVRITAEVLKLWRLAKACLSEKLFRKGDYSAMITDEDALSESNVKQNVNHDIKKWSDKNHVVVTFRKMLISGKAQDFGKIHRSSLIQ